MQDVTLNKTLPHAAEAERAVLGAILLGNAAATFLHGRRWEDRPKQPPRMPIAEPDY